MTDLPPLDVAGRRRSPATCPAITLAARRATRGCGTQPTRPPSTRSSPSCATPLTTATGSVEGDHRRPLARRPARPRSARIDRARHRPAPRVAARAPRQGRPPPRGRDGRMGLGQLRPWLFARAALPRGRCFASSTARPAADRGPPLRSAGSFALSPQRLGCGAGLRRSCATRTRSSSRASGCR